LGSAVAGDPDRPRQVLRPHQRPAAAGLVGADHLDIDPEAAGHRRAPFQLDQAFGGSGETQAAALPVAGRLAGLGLEAGVEEPRVARELRQVVGRPELADQAGRVPARPARDLPALEEQHIRPAELGEVIRDAAPDDAAADDDHPGGAGHGFTHHR
jgi:hypothetical protein